MPWNGPPPRTEKELLIRQEATAKAAMAKTAQLAARTLLRVADPRVWTEEHPWKSTGIAAAAGFVVATRGNFPKKAEASPEEAGAAETPASPSTGTQAWDLITSILLSSGTDALKGVLTPWLAQKVQSALQRRGLGTEEEVPEPPLEEAPA